MKKVETPEEISSAIKRHFCRGMITNCFISSETISKEINDNNLFYEENSASLIIFKQRSGFRIMYFYLNNITSSLPQIPSDTVCEIPYRDKDEALIAASSLFQNNGFEKMFSRERLACIGKDTSSDISNLSFAKKEDFSSICSIFDNSFDRRTGCLPGENEILDDIVKQNFIVQYKDNKPVGMLHINRQKTMSEIRHLAVIHEERGKGIAFSLVEDFLNISSGKIKVWVRDDYTPALTVYEKNGFIFDSMKSDVLYF